MKILLFSHVDQIGEYAAYIDGFKKRGSVESLFLTMGEEESKLGLQTGAFDVVKDILPESSQIDVSPAELAKSMQALSELEDRLGGHFVNQDIAMDRYFRGQRRLDVDLNTVPLIWTTARTKQFMYVLYRQLEQEIERFKPDFVFVETNYAPGRMVWRLAHHKNIPAGVFWTARFWPQRVYLETGLGLDWGTARNEYLAMDSKPMVGEELATVKLRLEAIRTAQEKPPYMKSERAKGSPNLLKRLAPGRLFSGLSDWLGKRAQTFARNPRVLPGQLYSPMAKYARYRNGRKAMTYLFKHQTAMDQFPTKKYAVYFLHLQPELTVEEMAFDYQNQVNTIRSIVAALPADMCLVVKEHTFMLGFRPLEIYNQLVHMPGVVLARTHEHSHQLLTRASVVVTLTGTVGLEAVLYGIPAIVLGSVFFDRFRGIHKPENLAQLRQLLSDPAALHGATDEDALRALGSMHRASAPGRAARVDWSLQEPDDVSAKWMLSEMASRCSGPAGQYRD